MAGWEAILRACAADFWEPRSGSRPFYWLWTEPFEQEACLEVKPSISGDLLCYALQKCERKKLKRDDKWDLVTKNIEKIRTYQYIELGMVL